MLVLSANRDCHFTNARLRKCIDSISILILMSVHSPSLACTLLRTHVSHTLPELVSEILFEGCFISPLLFYRSVNADVL